MKRFSKETRKILKNIVQGWDDFHEMNFMAVVQRLRVFHLKELPQEAQRALRRGGSLSAPYHIWSRLGLEPTRVQAAERIAKDVGSVIHRNLRPYIENVAFSFSGCSIMREHFPFFLTYFPDTARNLSQVLTELLADTKRSALWESAIALLRQQHDAEYAVARGWDTQLEERYNDTLEQLIQSIPNPNPLWFCFDSYEYLRVALDDALTFDVLGETVPYGVKMLHCAPDNLIWLKPNFDPVNFYHPQTAQCLWWYGTDADTSIQLLNKVEPGVLSALVLKQHPLMAEHGEAMHAER